jgi:hypothetical protein
MQQNTVGHRLKNNGRPRDGMGESSPQNHDTEVRDKGDLIDERAAQLQSASRGMSHIRKSLGPPLGSTVVEVT